MVDLKNTTDDALPNYLTSLKFKQTHSLTDVRLALGYSAVLIAAITFYADYKLGWDKTKAATFWAVLIYFTLNGALTFWIWGVEKGTVFTGEIDQPSTETTLVSQILNVGYPTIHRGASCQWPQVSQSTHLFTISPFATKVLTRKAKL